MISIVWRNPGFYTLLIKEHFTDVSVVLTADEVKLLADQIKELGF